MFQILEKQQNDSLSSLWGAPPRSVQRADEHIGWPNDPKLGEAGVFNSQNPEESPGKVPIILHLWLPWLLESCGICWISHFSVTKLGSRTLPQRRSAWLSLGSNGQAEIGEAFRPNTWRILVCEKNLVNKNQPLSGELEITFHWSAFDRDWNLPSCHEGACFLNTGCTEILSNRHARAAWCQANSRPSVVHSLCILRKFPKLCILTNSLLIRSASLNLVHVAFCLSRFGRTCSTDCKWLEVWVPPHSASELDSQCGKFDEVSPMVLARGAIWDCEQTAFLGCQWLSSLQRE